MTKTKPNHKLSNLPKTDSKMDEIFKESGHGLVWAEFKERGCPAKEEDYFLTKKEVKELVFVKKLLQEVRQEERKSNIKVATNFFSEIVHDRFCLKTGKQFKKCCRCLVEDYLSLLEDYEN